MNTPPVFVPRARQKKDKSKGSYNFKALYDNEIYDFESVSPGKLMTAIISFCQYRKYKKNEHWYFVTHTMAPRHIKVIKVRSYAIKRAIEVLDGNDQDRLFNDEISMLDFIDAIETKFKPWDSLDWENMTEMGGLFLKDISEKDMLFLLYVKNYEYPDKHFTCSKDPSGYMVYRMKII